MSYYHKTTGIVLKTRKQGESSKLLTFYTRALGRINAVAKGARKIKSRFGSSLEVFTESKLMLYKQPSAGLYVVSQSQIISPHVKLYDDPGRFAAASVMADFLYTHTVQAEENDELYTFFRASLKQLEAEADPENVLLSFMLKFLSVSGYSLNLRSCASCGKPDRSASKSYRVSAKHGGIICEACSKKVGDSVVITASSLKGLIYMQEKGYTVMGQLKLEPGSPDEIKKVLANFLSYIFEYKLNSMKVMEDMAKYGKDI